jgi:pyruvate carboxylase subunit B
VIGPWKKIADGYGKMVLGYFGKTPKTPDKEVVKIASEQLNLPPTKESPRLLNDKNPKKGIKAATEELKKNNLPVTDENIFIVATCADKGLAYLKGEAKVSVRYAEKIQKKNETAIQCITTNGNDYKVELKDNKAIVNGETYSFELNETVKKETEKVQEKNSSNTEAEVICAPMVGSVVRINVEVGAQVKAGQDLLILEVMKMENPIKASKDGRVSELLVSKGTQVSVGQKLIVLE